MFDKYYYFFLLVYGRKSIALGSNLWNGHFNGLHVLRAFESENPAFSGWFVCQTVISITQKQIATETILWKVFYICIICGCYTSNV